MNDAQTDVDFSVLVPVYDKENPVFLKSAFGSIYDKQTLKPDEVVVVCDGRLTDELYEVISDFTINKGGIVKTVQLNQKRGLGTALRKGVEQCSGRYIFRMDSDDICEKDRFEKQLAYAKAHPELDVIGGSIAEFDSDPENCYRIRSCPLTHGDIVKMIRTRNPMNHVSVCIKRSSLDKCGGYEAIERLEDYYLWLKMLTAGCKFGNMPDVLVRVRVGNGFTERHGSKKLVKGWMKLQRYMVKNRIIRIPKAVVNMVCIVVFTLIPSPVREFMYNKFLRKNLNCKDNNNSG